jgi:N4-gp56 family major capsid protein
MDQLAFLTLSGISYTLRNNGAPRIGSDFPYLEFAADVTAPTAMRRVRWDNTAKQIVVGGTTSAVTATDTPAWELFVQLKALAKEQYIRPLRANGGKEYYVAFLTPQAMAKLKLDPTFMQNLRHAEVRGEDNPLFTGDPIVIDGIVFHEHRHVFNTSGAAPGNKWGSSGNVDGCQILFCGAQALAMADIGPPTWVEKGFDYDNSQGISVSKILGFLKPKFTSIYASNTVQDFGVISAYVAQ